MKKPLSFGSLLLLTSALIAPPALAQGAEPQTAEPALQAQGENDAESDGGEAVDISAPGASSGGDEIVVTGRFIPNIARITPEVVSVLSSADIARTGEGDIAGALQRVTGLSVVGNGFVYVRGLGDRYSLSLLNGSPLPSPEPLRRVVPLDIFPTNAIASALVQKSYSVNYPGEFGGGVINLTTLAVPKESFFQLGGSIGIDTETTGKLGYTYYGGDTDWLGYDDGTRKVPGFVKEAGAGGTSLTPEQATQLSNASTTLLQRNRDIPPQFKGEFSFGTAKDIANGRIGIIAAAGIDNSWRTRDAIQQATDDVNGGVQRDFRTVLTENRMLVNGLLGLGAEFGEHKIRITNLYIHDTLKQSRLGAGSDANISSLPGVPALIEQNTNWFERQLIDNQAVGEFKFGDFNVSLRGSHANTKRKSPYERQFTYQYSTLVNDYVNSLSGTQSASIAFSDLSETLWAGAADLSYTIQAARPITVSAGYAYNDTDRVSSRYTFRYVGPGAAPLNPVVSQLRPDYLLSDYTILTNGIILQNTSTSQGSAEYDASLRIHAGYGQVEAELMDGLRATVGVRYETALERVTSIGAATGTNLDNDYWLPAATVTWNFAEDMQLRLHGSRTLARPQFRELAPQIYQDFESDRQFIGNPFLVDSKLDNFEARYEWYYARDQQLSIAGFYKKIKNPVEAIATFTSDGRLQTGFSNAPSANLLGGEIELRKYIPLDTLGGDFFATHRIVLIGNYSYTKSKIKAGDELVPDPIQPGGTPRYQQANLLFSDGAPMVGQSDHLVNVQVGLEDTEALSQITMLFSYASERVTNRGPISSGVRLPDIVEKPGIRLDVVARKGVTIGNAEVELKFEARNLTRTKYQEYQQFDANRVDINTYALGRTFSLGASVKF
ncbi:TonB-dependent receptor domain-containing protein [Sphingobium boeckii]|uniref:Outer membrane receptor protein involved in Fe transport n=1 Tax=Sphingobium boeckii TaxID=1082345 RepID=A0A7W9EGT6_9SPHN|nr:TonB-dependent receptor [Sphingobium boeckii]MBB5687440.1 outer membrane receptor protein involved in Fe transport [Sphingobium boeckii]